MGNSVKLAVSIVSSVYITRFESIHIAYFWFPFDIQCASVQNGLYEMKWYALPPNYQRQLAQVLHRWQNMSTFSIGPFEDLDFVTATNVHFPLIERTVFSNEFWNFLFPPVDVANSHLFGLNKIAEGWRFRRVALREKLVSPEKCRIRNKVCKLVSMFIKIRNFQFIIWCGDLL